MKRILSLLLCFVFLHSQAFAMSGGPSFAGSGFSVVGTYAGTMIPETRNVIFANPAIVLTDQSFRNSLGIFVLNVEESGPAAGSFLFFDEGEAYHGTVDGVADPENGQFNGLVTGVALSNNSSTGIEFLSPISVVGRMDGKIKQGTGSNPFAVRIKGTAFTQVQGYIEDASPNGFGLGVMREVEYVISGFQQSSVSTGATIPAPSTTVPQAPTPGGGGTIIVTP